MGNKKVNFNKTGISQIPDNKPVVYTIETASGNPIYIGSAKRSRVQERLTEHLNEIPGKTFRIRQFQSIADAQESELRMIKRNEENGYHL